MSHQTAGSSKSNKAVIGYVLLILLLLFVLYVFYQFTLDFPEFTWNKLNRTPKETLNDWVNTASIVNGFLSPLLLLGSVILLWLTWQTSKKELFETKEQLNFQSTRDTLKIILDDFFETIDTPADPTEFTLNQCAASKMHSGFTAIEKNNFKTLFNTNKTEFNENELYNFLKDSTGIGNITLQSLICTLIANNSIKDYSKHNLECGLYGHILLSNFYLEDSGLSDYINSVSFAITESLSSELSDKRFRLLSQIVICRLSLEVVVYLVLKIFIQLKKVSTNPIKKKALLNQLSTFNKIFASHGILEEMYTKYDFLDNTHKSI